MIAFLVDDEPLALKRLTRLIEATGRVEIAGSATDPVEAVARLRRSPVEVLFLDIQMPALNGFELLAQLDEQPLVVFTTAYDQYALQAFEANSIDYLLKPVEPERLAKALDKLDRLRGGAEPRLDLRALADQVAAAMQARAPQYLSRVASRVGEKVEFVDVVQVSHFYAKDKLTFAAAAAKHHVIDHTIAALEQKLDPARFLRVHRSSILNLDHVRELHTWFGGKMVVRLKDGKTELTVARDRVAALRERLGA